MQGMNASEKNGCFWLKRCKRGEDNGMKKEKNNVTSIIKTHS